MMKKLSAIFWVALMAVASACEMLPFLQEETATREVPPIARVNDNYLFPDDLDGLVPQGSSLEDSINITKKYVESWVKKQLMINKASDVISYQEAEIERKVLDYRYALVIHQYEKFYIERELDKDVDEQDIVEYYEEKKDNFLLKQNIVKCLFAKVPIEAPKLDAFRKQLKGYPNSDLEAIKSYAFQFATKSYLEDTLWINFDDIIQGTPLVGIPNKVQFLSTNNFVETTDDKFIYFLRIISYKISDQISPLEFIRDDIKNIIINRRKVALKEKLLDQVYKEGINKRLFEIYEAY